MAIKSIDWSCKHDIFIKNADGSLSRMDEPYYRSEQVAPGTWKVLSSGDYSYLVVGDGVGLSIDCGYGAGNIREYLEGLGGVPVPYVANTHDHFDHTANNAYFDKAYMSAFTAQWATDPFPSFEGIDFHPDEYERVVLQDGDVIPLKGRELIAISVPDHAAGSMMYLDRKARILFSGDEIFGGNMGKSLNGGLASWVRNLEKVEKHLDEFDILCGGAAVMPKERFINFLACARYAQEHEGTIPERRGPGGPPRTPQYDAEGHIIYDRMMPHAGDRSRTPHIEHDPANMRMVEYAGTRIMYDITMKDQ